MGVINKTTEKINELLDKIEDAPDKIENGKTPVFVAGTTTTLDPGMSATAEVVLVGTDPEGNPQYKINIGVPKGLDGTGGSGGGVADSVQWANVLNKPGWVNSATKPTYTASEVGALPADTTIPTKTSQLTNDSKFLISSDFKTINGESIVGEGNISLSGSGGISDAPKDGKTYGRNNGSWVETSQMDEAPSDGNAYARKNKGWTTVLESTESALLGNYLKPDAYTVIEPTDSVNIAIGKLEAGIASKETSNSVYYIPSKVSSLNIDSSSDDIIDAFGGIEVINELINTFRDISSFYIKSSIKNIPVSIGIQDTGFGIKYVDLSFLSNNYLSSEANEFVRINFLATSSKLTKGEIKRVLIGGYALEYSVYNLSTDSTSEEISIAVGGENGLKKIIDAVRNGSDIYIAGEFNGVPLKTDLSVNMYSQSENGDMSIIIAGIGMFIFKTSLGGALSISYTKSSNTFEAHVLTIK